MNRFIALLLPLLFVFPSFAGTASLTINAEVEPVAMLRVQDAGFIIQPGSEIFLDFGIVDGEGTPGGGSDYIVIDSRGALYIKKNAVTLTPYFNSPGTHRVNARVTGGRTSVSLAPVKSGGTGWIKLDTEPVTILDPANLDEPASFDAGLFVFREETPGPGQTTIAFSLE